MVSHLFLADEFCCKASMQEVKQKKDLLAIYENASGQLINFEKSVVFFSANSCRNLRKEICSELGNIKEALSGKYLDLPMMIGRSKPQAFGFVKERLQNKMQN